MVRLRRSGRAAAREEVAGGVGLGLRDAVLLFEEAGRALLPGPLVATHLAAGLVEGAAEGEAVVTAVDGELPVTHLGDADGAPAGDPRVLTGEALRVFAAAARPVRSMDPLTPLHRPERGPLGRPGLPGRPGPPGLSGRLRHEAALLTAAEQLGSCARTTEKAVQYAREREKFGAPIGSFQAVKHLCADMLARTVPARAAVYAAALTADPVEIAAAKLLADEAAVRNARDCLQIHGGMGFTWEADVHLHLKRAWLRSASWLTQAAAEELLAADLRASGPLPGSSAAYGCEGTEAGGGG
ncbi:acyl-CoA dehydrogenase family protein [Streptomyces sp. NPDC049916]|uniref:acyl-CoA dehydrogenase family protein n=1 Tax=Streptomyces sp. NPDC049916 TaxID=3155156 RepID=UPI0034311BEA